ncbi:MAG: alpha/beta fold hydrolase [Ilumatobacteraceae bacterium]|nr:alpha/beta fold hydrolase [Ilumatobacteraceae bacterium]
MPFIRAADDVRIHYEVTGRRSGPPVLFIQGLGADRNGWNLQRLATAPRYRAVAVDNRGAGRSDKPHGRYHLEQMADDAVAVLDDLGIDCAHVVGASMGGAISQIVAIKHRSRVRSLTLACTAARNLPWREELLSSWRDAALERGIGAMGHDAARWVIGPRSFRRLLPAIGWLGPFALGRPAHAFAAQVDAILDATTEYGDLVDELDTIDVPTLVLVGNQDILTPRGDSEELAERIPTAELVVISGAAHGFMVEHAATFNMVLLDFLGRAEAAWHERSVGEAAAS